MKEKLNQLADRLDRAMSSDMPRQTMSSVAGELRFLAKDVPDDNGSRSHALELADAIDNHQYGLRGFGDGSLSRGRDLTQRERETIKQALRAYGVLGTFNEQRKEPR
jgi:hypothetical protein